MLCSKTLSPSFPLSHPEPNGCSLQQQTVISCLSIVGPIPVASIGGIDPRSLKAFQFLMLARPRDLLPIPKIYLLTEGTQQGLFTAHSRSGLLKFSFSSKNSDVYPYLQEVKFPRPASPLSQVFLIALTSAT